MDNNLDAIVMTEIWLISGSDLPLRHTAPSGYSIVEVARPGFTDNCVTNHGGIVIVHHDSHAVRVITADSLYII